MLNFGTKNKMGIKVNGKDEFEVFYEIIKYSKTQIFDLMRTILNNDKNIEIQMDDAILKYNIVCYMQNTLADINEKGFNPTETVFIPIDGPEEADLLSGFASKMLNELLDNGFSSNDKNLKQKSMIIAYGNSLFEKLSVLGKMSTTNPE